MSSKRTRIGYHIPIPPVKRNAIAQGGLSKGGKTTGTTPHPRKKLPRGETVGEATESPEAQGVADSGA